MAQAFLNRHLSELMNSQLTAVSKYVQAVADKADKAAKGEDTTALDAEIKKLLATINDKRDGLDVNLLTGVENYSNKFQKAWIKYKVPTHTISEFIMDYETKIKEKPDLKLSDDCVVHRGNIVTGIYWHELEKKDGKEQRVMKETAPLQFAGNITMELLEDCLVISPLSKVLDWTRTLENLLEFGEKIGLSREQLATAIKELVKNYLPHYYASIQHEKNPKEVYDAACTMMDWSSNKAIVKQKMQEVTRLVGQDIGVPIRTIRSLAGELFRLMGPDLSEEDVAKQSDRHANKVLKSFVEEDTYKELIKYKNNQKIKFHKDVKLSDALMFISQIEDDPRFRLLSTKRQRSNQHELELNNLNLHLVGLHEGLRDDPMLADEEYEDALYALQQDVADGDSGNQLESVFSRAGTPHPYEATTRKGATATRKSHPNMPLVSNQEWSKYGVPRGGNVRQTAMAANGRSGATPRRVPTSAPAVSGIVTQAGNNTLGTTRGSSGSTAAATPSARPAGTTSSAGRNRSATRSPSPAARRSPDRSGRSKSPRRSGYRDVRYRRSTSRGRREDKSPRPRSKSPRTRYKVADSYGVWRSVSRGRIGVKNSDGTVRPLSTSRTPSRESKCNKCGKKKHSGNCRVRRASSSPGDQLSALMPFNFVDTQNLN